MIMRREGWMPYLYTLIFLIAPTFDFDIEAPRCKKRLARNKTKPPSSTLYC
jgi:hypothetical protein